MKEGRTHENRPQGGGLFRVATGEAGPGREAVMMVAHALEPYFNRPIKEVISSVPDLAGVLQAYGIGCVPCHVGSCLLKDIVEIHRLAPEEEKKLLADIARTISPDSEMEAPVRAQPPRVRNVAAGYSPPLQRLADEHRLIKRWLALIPEVIRRFDLTSAEGRGRIREGLDFIRSYADRFHHAKEENILFKYFDEDLEIIRAMHQDHETARAQVRGATERLERRQARGVAEHLEGYRELLLEHVKKEDEILYPWMDRQLTITQIGRISAQFDDADAQAGRGVAEKYQEWIAVWEREWGRPTLDNHKEG